MVELEVITKKNTTVACQKILSYYGSMDPSINLPLQLGRPVSKRPSLAKSPPQKINQLAIQHFTVL